MRICICIYTYIAGAAEWGGAPFLRSCRFPPPRSLRCGPHFPRLLHNHQNSNRPLSSLPPSLSSSSRHKATATPQVSGLKEQATGDERDERRPASPPRLPPGGHTRDGDAAAAEALHKSAKDLSPSSPRVPCVPSPRASSVFIHPSVPRLTSCGLWVAVVDQLTPAGEFSLTWSAGWSGRPRRRQRHVPPPPPPPPRPAAARSGLISST